MNKFLLFSALLSAGLTMTAATDTKVDVTVGDWKFAAERFDKGVSISEITTIGTATKGAVDFTTATFSNTDGENKIFNIRPRVFRGCTALTSITLPKSLESFMPMAADEFFSTTLIGADSDIKDKAPNETDDQAVTRGENRNRDMSADPIANTSFVMNIDVTFENWDATTDKSVYTGRWGSALLTSQEVAIDNVPSNGFQIWLNSPTNHNGVLQIKADGNTAIDINNTTNLLTTCNGHIAIKLEYNNTDKTIKVWVNNDTDTPNQELTGKTLNNINWLSTNVRAGVKLVADITEPTDVSTAEVDNPFRGCVNLMNFYVEEGNTIFGVGPNGALRKNGEVKAYPYGRLFNKYLRFNVTDENGAGTGVYLTSGVNAKADGTPNTAAEDGSRQFIYTEGKTGASLFEFKYFPETSSRAISIQAINPSYDGVEMWGGGKANQHNRWEAVANRNFSGENIGMAVVPGRQNVTFNITIGAYYITIADNKAILTANKTEATEFAIEFAKFIDVPLTNGYATACLPVAVTAPNIDGLHVCDAIVADNKVVLKNISNSIAARKPVIFYSESNAETVQLTIDEAAAASNEATTDATSVLKGFSCLCKVLTAADSYGYDGAATNFSQTTSTAANSAILAKPADATWAETLTIDASETTGIKEVESAAAAKANAIYDLQGRRVSNASKGIFIINGVKTLVK